MQVGYAYPFYDIISFFSACWLNHMMLIWLQNIATKLILKEIIIEDKIFFSGITFFYWGFFSPLSWH